MYLTKEQIFKTSLKTKDIEAFGGIIRIRELTARERDSYEQFLADIGKKDLKHIRVKLLAYAIVDENNNQLFTENEVKDLDNLSASEVDKVWDAIRMLSGISQQEIEETEKNS